MEANFQLVTQVYALQRELNGVQHQQTQWWFHKLRQISALDYYARVLTVGQHSALAVKGAIRLQEIFQLPEFEARNRNKDEFMTMYSFQNTTNERTRLVKAHDMSLNTKYFPVTLPDSLSILYGLFKDTFVLSLYPKIYRRKTIFRLYYEKCDRTRILRLVALKTSCCVSALRCLGLMT
jgi:hypothetical protein